MADDEQLFNQLTDRILAAACHVHSALGPGLLESAYEACLAHELRRHGLEVDRQRVLPVRYDNVVIDAGYRLDLLVNGRVIVEVKSVQHLIPLHHAQVLTYLKLSGHPVGLLLNFNVTRMKDGGIKRLVHNYHGPTPSPTADPPADPPRHSASPR